MLHKSIVDKARAVPIEDELARRGFPFWIKPRHNNIGQPCPICGGRDRFSANTKKQLWRCRRCDAGGDIISLVRHLDGLSFEDAVGRLAGRAPSQKPAIGRHTDSPAPQRAVTDNSALALRIWRESGDPRGSLVEQYLRTRRVI
jgi:phage/plasmid primase-like uncharacterized protein